MYPVKCHLKSLGIFHSVKYEVSVESEKVVYVSFSEKCQI